VYGWGEVNVYNSSQYILDDAIMNGMVRAGANPVRFPVDVPSGLTSLKATVVWTDEQGAPESKVALINDIDLVLVDPSVNKHYPWNLDPWDPQAAATKGANHVDNVEQVQVDNPDEGRWEAQVIPYNIPTIQQNFTIVIDGIKPIKLTKSIKVFNDGGGDLILNSITPDRPYDWLSITCGGKAVKDIVIKSGESATIDLTVDFAYSPEGQTALLTFNSNAANEKPVVIVHVLPD
jgi:hypothetical protein